MSDDAENRAMFEAGKVFLDYSSRLSAWLFASLVTLNAGGALLLLSTDGPAIAGWSKGTAVWFFGAGVLAALLSAFMAALTTGFMGAMMMNGNVPEDGHVTEYFGWSIVPLALISLVCFVIGSVTIARMV